MPRLPHILALLVLLSLSAHGPVAARQPAGQPPAASMPSPGAEDSDEAAAIANPEEVAALRESDRALRERLAARLAVIPGLEKTRVEVTGGLVRLRGEAVDDARRQLAGTIAEQAEGVLQVDNQLSIDTTVAVRTAPVFEHARETLARLVSAIPLFLLALLIVWGSALLGRWLSTHLKLLRRPHRNPFVERLSRQGVQLVVVLVGVVIALDLLNATALVGALLGTAGIIGIAVGFAFRDVAENYIAGILLSLRQPFAPHDHVLIDGHEGKVAALTSRATILITLDGNHLRVPNAQVFKGVMLNYSRNPTRRLSFDLSVGNDASISRAQQVARECLGGIDGLLEDPAPSVSVVGLSDSTTQLRLSAWVDQRETSFGRARSESIRLVRRAFIEQGLGVPDTRYRVDLGGSGPAPGDASKPTTTSRPVPAPEPEDATVADLSPERHIDRQVDEERTGMIDGDLLDPNARRE